MVFRRRTTQKGIMAKVKRQLLPSLKNPLRVSKRIEKMPRKRRVGRLVLRGFLILVGVTLLAMAGTFAWFAKDLPGPNAIAQRGQPESTKIYDRNGELLYEAHGTEKRTVLQPNEVPLLAKEATVSAEDKAFYKHHGLSARGMARAIFYRLTGKSGYLQGGSTITQQYVKNAIPEVGTSRSIGRKIKEAIITLEIEQIYTKDQILTQYLNAIPYGNTAYGIESATKTYFDKSASKDGLTIDEAALLASIPQAPSRLNPWGTHTDLLIDRRNYVLKQMREMGYISDQELADAMKVDTLAKLGKRRENIQAPHFVFFVKELLAEKYGETAIDEGGLKVTTSLDLNVQKMAEQAVAEQFPDVQKKAGAGNAAMAVLDPTNGQVLAMVGSVDFFDTSKEGNVNVSTSLRQPGSSFKPLVYAAAFKGQWGPGSTLFDVPTDFGGGYKPDNYDNRTHGAVSVRQALANSLNIPAVKMISLVGVDTAIKQAKEMGITSLNRGADFYGPPLVLGSGEVRLVDLVSAFTTFAAQGKHYDMTPILKVVDQKGNTLEENTNPQPKQVLDPAIAYQISDILSDNNARSLTFGTHSPLAINGKTVAAKTGTTSDYRDAWTIGFTPSIAAGVWVGNNDNKPLQRGGSGAMAAAPIWNAFMNKYLAGKPDQAWTKPDNIQDVTIEKYSGKLADASTPDNMKVTDHFAPWQIRTGKPDAIAQLKVCKSDPTKLAPDGAPDDQTDTRTFMNIHSEMPDKPNWEQPVQAWAAANGLTGMKPPTETCTIQVGPSVTMTSPTANQTYTGGLVTLEAGVSGQVDSVNFFIDNVNVGSATGNPYRVTYDVTQLSDGAHEAAAQATGGGQTSRATVSFTVQKASSSASSGGTGDGTSSLIFITDISVTPDKTSAWVSWKTNIATTGTVNWGTTPTMENGQTSLSNTTHSVHLVGLSPATPYFYKITAKAGTSSTQSTMNTFTTQS